MTKRNSKIVVVLQKMKKTLADAAHIHKKVGRLKSDQEHQEIETGRCALLHGEHRPRDELLDGLAFESDGDADADQRSDEQVARVVQAEIDAGQHDKQDREEGEE